MSDIADALVAEMAEMPIIDAHEHLMTESEAVAGDADIFTRVFCHYTVTNAIMAGLRSPCDVPIREWLHDTTVPLEERWLCFRDCLDDIRDTGYVRSAVASVRELYGYDAIDDGNYREISDRLQADNRPGLYDSILRDRCHVERVINQGSWVEARDGYAVGVSWHFLMLGPGSPALAQSVEACSSEDGASADAMAWVRRMCRDLQEQGMVGIKIWASVPTACISDEDADRIYAKAAGNRASDDEARALCAWALNAAVGLAPEYGLVVAAHCGLSWCGGGDLRDLDPSNLIPLITRYPETTFDLYHAGIPWVRKLAVMANQYGNIVLNLCWCYQISPYMTESVLNEIIDLVSANRIIAYGGDNHYPEKALGALVLGRETLARALAVRIERKQMTMDRAVALCRAWFYENPKRIYRL